MIDRKKRKNTNSPARPSSDARNSAPQASVAKSTSWGGVAEWYDKLLNSEVGTYQKEVVLPNLVRLMSFKPGDKIADIACGQGFFAAGFAAAGAEVIGTDISPELLKKAAENAPGVAFHAAPANAMPHLEDGWADQATIVLAIQNIEDVRGTLAECARILRPGGRLHIVMNHPAFRIPKRSSWGWDRDGKQFRRMDGYLTESRSAIEMHPGSDPTIKTWSFHRSLQYYVKALVRAGFRITNLEEWISNKVSDSGPRAPEENRARREFPLFMYLDAERK